MKSSRDLKWEEMQGQLVRATDGVALTHPVIVSSKFYGEMRFHCRGGDYGHFEIICLAALLKKGLMAVWKGRPIFVKREGDPELYPEGLGIIKQADPKWELK